jgi:succinate dehydrogenase iron-sulfur subunit
VVGLAAKPLRLIRVLRWSPGEAERYQAYSIAAGPDTTVLDALVDIQRGQDHTLAFRYACRVGMCGSCAVVVNGRERWACRTRLIMLDTDVIDVRPLYHLPLLRDLVVDMAPFNEKLRGAGAAFVPDPDPAVAEYAIVPGESAERREIDAAIECIGCGMCLSACTMVAHAPRFPGPAALNRVFTLRRDRRSTAVESSPRLLSDDGLARCHGQGNCTAVCPMDLSPERSIAHLKRLAVRQLFGPNRDSPHRDKG